MSTRCGCPVVRSVAMASMIVGVSVAFGGCGKAPETPPEDRIVRVSLDPADRDAIMAPRYDVIRSGLLEVRALEASMPDPEVDREAYSAHADAVSERTKQVIAMMADERWTPDERRLMQRALRFSTAADLGGEPETSAPIDGAGTGG